MIPVLLAARMGIEMKIKMTITFLETLKDLKATHLYRCIQG